MYYISGKNLVEQNDRPIQGWSVVTEEGVVCTTMVGGMGKLAAMVVCEQLNTDPNKYKGYFNNQKMVVLNYDDNKIIWDANNVSVLEALYFSAIGDKSVGDIRANTDINNFDIDAVLDLLVKEGWVNNYKSHLDHEDPIKEGDYRISFMGSKKLEWLTGVKKKE